jgi:hypothetical protein
MSRNISIQYNLVPPPNRDKIMIFSASFTSGVTKNKFYSLTGAGVAVPGTANTLAQNGGCIIPVAGTFDSLFVGLKAAAAGVGESFTAYKNGAAQTLTTLIAAAASSNSDIVHSFNCVAGDFVGLSFDNTSDGTSTDYTSSMRFTPT